MDNAEGIERQKQRCEAFALARGWDVVKTYTDNAVSASKDRSEATWGALVADARAGEFETVVAVKVDRLARRVKDVLELIEMGLGIATLEGELDTTTDMGRFQVVLLTALAELEANRKGQRHKDAHASRAAQGLARTNKRPYGWKADGMTLEPEEAEHLRTALKNLIEPGKNRSTIRAEVRRMNAAGARTVRYKDRADGSQSGGKEWTPRTLTITLDRERMAGILVRNGEVQAKSQIQPIVTKEEWEAYRALRKDPTRRSRERQDGPDVTPLKHYLSGVPLCPCGQRLISTPSRRKDVSVPYYQCPNRVGQTGHVSIAAHIIESQTAAWMYGHISGGWAKLGSSAGQVKTLRAQLAALATERADMSSNLVIKGVDKAPIIARLAEIDGEASRAAGELETALAKDLGAQWLDELVKAGEDSADSAEAFLEWFTALEPTTRRALVKTHVEIKVSPGQGNSRVRFDPLGSDAKAWTPPPAPLPSSL